jgi:hypothetical protein
MTDYKQFNLYLIQLNGIKYFNFMEILFYGLQFSGEIIVCIFLWFHNLRGALKFI